MERDTMHSDILIFDAKLCYLGQDRFDEKVLFDPITNTPLELKSGPKIPFWKTLGQPDRIRAFVVSEHQSTVWKTQVESTHYANQSKVIVNLFLLKLEFSTVDSNYSQPIKGCSGEPLVVLAM